MAIAVAIAAPGCTPTISPGSAVDLGAPDGPVDLAMPDLWMPDLALPLGPPPGWHVPDGGFPPVLAGSFLDIAAGGAAGYGPENTLVAFQKALQAGAGAIDLVLRATSDGAIVVLADATVDRTTNGTGAVASMTLDLLRQYDAGYDYTVDGGATYPYRNRGLHVPTLDEALAGFPSASMVLELDALDGPGVDAVVQKVESAGAVGRVEFAATTDALVQRVRQRLPDPVTTLGSTEMQAFEALDPLAPGDYVPAGAVLKRDAASVTSRDVTLAHRLGMKVQPYTVDDPSGMAAMIALGVDGLFTNKPGLLSQVLAGSDGGVPGLDAGTPGGDAGVGAGDAGVDGGDGGP